MSSSKKDAKMKEWFLQILVLGEVKQGQKKIIEYALGLSLPR